MRKAMLFALVAMIAAAAFAAPEDWYAPIGWWQGGIEGEADVVAEIDGVTKTYHCVVDENGYSADLEFLIDTFSKNPFTPRTVITTLHAMYEALQAQIMVYNMAEKLEEFFNGGETTFTDADGRTVTGGYSFSIGANGKVTLKLTGIGNITAGGGLVIE